VNREREEFKALIHQHSSLTDSEEKALVDAFDEVRAHPSSRYDVYVMPDSRHDEVLNVQKYDAFKGLPADVQERLGALVDDLKGRFVAEVQLHKPWKLTLGMHRPLIRYAYDSVKDWNQLIGQLSAQNPELKDLKLKFGKHTDGLMRDELLQKLGTSR
jgi:hypothetical protein